MDGRSIIKSQRSPPRITVIRSCRVEDIAYRHRPGTGRSSLRCALTAVTHTRPRSCGRSHGFRHWQARRARLGPRTRELRTWTTSAVSALAAVRNLKMTDVGNGLGPGDTRRAAPTRQCPDMRECALCWVASWPVVTASCQDYRPRGGNFADCARAAAWPALTSWAGACVPWLQQSVSHRLSLIAVLRAAGSNGAGRVRVPASRRPLSALWPARERAGGICRVAAGWPGPGSARRSCRARDDGGAGGPGISAPGDVGGAGYRAGQRGRSCHRVGG